MQPIITAKSEPNVGFLPPPPGVTPNFDHPESIGFRLIITIAIFLPLSTFFLALRLYTRRFIIRVINADDYMIITAYLFAIAFATLEAVLTRYGLGQHSWDITFTAFNSYYAKLSVPFTLCYCLSIMFAKLSILLLYLRLSPEHYFRIIVKGLSAIVIIYSSLASFQFLFSCKPMAKYWDLTITHGSCINKNALFALNAVLNSVTDGLMLLLPVIMLWHVGGMPRSRKVGVIAILMLGAGVFIISIVRVFNLFASEAQGSDITWNLVTNTMVGTIEANVGIICACLPHLMPLFRRYVGQL